MTISVRCTKDEYMRFCARRRVRWPLTVCGLLLGAAGGVVLLLGAARMMTATVFFLGGAIVLLWDTVLLPAVRKGDAGRRYDRSRSLPAAITLTFSDTVVTVDSTEWQGTLPLDAVTEVIETPEMLGLRFGAEWTALIPRRVLTDEQADDIAARCRKEETA
ncbi:MAG: hypothetical protein IJU16_03470 [Clostridia bacterium]|nr:hypothetical protein [Clostridia bacterium]